MAPRCSLLIPVWHYHLMLGKLPVPGRPTNLDQNRAARAYCACSRCGWGLFGYCAAGVDGGCLAFSSRTSESLEDSSKP